MSGASKFPLGGVDNGPRPPLNKEVWLPHTVLLPGKPGPLRVRLRSMQHGRDYVTKGEPRLWYGTSSYLSSCLAAVLR